MKTAKELFPNCENEYGFSSPFGYGPIFENLGNVLIKVEERGYSGSSYLLMEKDGLYSLHFYYWGSCPGCDSLQSCGSYEAVQTLMDRFASEIEWESREGIIREVEKRIAKLNEWREEEEVEFLNQVKEYFNK